ncbi:TonB-dependent siderophore receptor [Olivibacter jilunii]|uniref:TonB-dependent siderophore receptor n=1 Tax=Olivibacter jilunii TaxID=985016 RepID=UPI003F5CC46A
MRFISSLFVLLLLSIAVTQGQTISIDTNTTRKLDEVLISARQKRYQIDSVTNVTRTPSSLQQTPQSIQVISQQVIRDKQAFTLNDLTNTLTGVKANNGMGYYSLRGFTFYNPFDAGIITFNGIRGNLYLWSQQPLLYNIEQVEVLRGPSSVLFSNNAPGGTINFTTKKPLSLPQLELSAFYGSWNAKRFSLDATGPLTKNKKLLYRSIVGYDQGNSFRDYQDVRNLLIAPSLSYEFNSTGKLLLEVNYAYEKAVQQYDRGSYVFTRPDGTFDFDYYPNNLTAQSPSDYGKTHNTSVNLRYDQQLGNKLRLTLVQRYVRSRFDYTDHIVTGLIQHDSISRSYQDWLYDQFNWQTTAFLNYVLKTGPLTHNILTGIDYNNYGWHKNDYRNSPAQRISIFNPDYSLDPPAPNPEVDYYDDNKERIHLIGTYVQDQIKYKDLILLLSLRYDDYSLRRVPLSARDNEQGNESDASAWIPRVGLVYSPIDALSFYGSYTTSFNPQTSNSVRNGGPFPPRTAKQVEIGSKSSWFENQFSLTLAAYQIDYANILAAAPTDENPNRQIAIDGTRSKGFEATTQGNIHHFNLILGYAYNDHVLLSDNTLGAKGSRFANAPKHMANAWIKYNLSTGFAKGLGIGIGGRYTSNQVGFVSAQNFLIPASTVLDAMLNYERNRYNIQFNVYNITNERYFLGGNSRTVTASLGNPFNFRIGINYLIR